MSSAKFFGFTLLTRDINRIGHYSTDQENKSLNILFECPTESILKLIVELFLRYVREGFQSMGSFLFK